MGTTVNHSNNDNYCNILSFVHIPCESKIFTHVIPAVVVFANVPHKLKLTKSTESFSALLMRFDFSSVFQFYSYIQLLKFFFALKNFPDNGFSVT